MPKTPGQLFEEMVGELQGSEKFLMGTTFTKGLEEKASQIAPNATLPQALIFLGVAIGGGLALNGHLVAHGTVDAAAVSTQSKGKRSSRNKKRGESWKD